MWESHVLLSLPIHCTIKLHSFPFRKQIEKGKIKISDFVGKRLLSEVGFEPTPTEVDCDLNAAP